MSFRRSLVLWFGLVMICAGVRPSHAQWTKLHTFPYPITCVKFLGDIGFSNVGFVSEGSYIYRSTDGGHTWLLSLRLPTACTATAFSFRDGRTGWCSVGGPTNVYACYKTMDGGQSWQALPPKGEGDDVYFNQTSFVLMLSLRNSGPGGSGQVLVSHDFGGSWSTFNAGMNGFAFASASSGISSTIGANFGVTGDGGQTWAVGTSGFHCWAPCAAPGVSRYIGPADQTQVVMRSDDGGVTWVPSGGVGGYLTGCAQATGCSAYVQATNGVYESTSLTSWTMMSGSPGNDYDTRFCVSGTDIFAGSQIGDLMHTTAAVTLWPTLAYERVQKSVTLPPGCPFDTLLEVFRNLTCSRVSLISLTLSDSSAFTILPLRLPLNLGPSDTLAIKLRAAPNGGGSFTATLHLRLQNGAGTSDTTLRVTLDASRFSSPIVDTLKVALAQCTTRDTVLAITNTHCDSLTLSTITLLDSTAISLEPLATPVMLAPDSTIRIGVHVRPGASGAFTEKVRLLFRYGSIVLDTTISIRVTVKDAIPSATLSEKLIDFKAISMCDVAERTLYVTNTMCDSVSVTELLFNADPSFTMDPIALPVRLGSGDSLAIHIHLNPIALGTPSGTLDIMLKNGAIEKLFSAAFEATVTEARHGVSVSPTAIVLNDLPPCTTFDTFIVVRNVSACDSLTVTSVTSNDTNVIAQTDVQLPYVVSADDSLIVGLHVAGATAGSAEIRIVGPGFDSLVSITANFGKDSSDHIALSAPVTERTLHRCDLDSIEVEVGGMGCGHTDIDSIWLSNGSQFTYGGPSSLRLASGTSRRVPVYLVPDAAGSFATEIIARDTKGEIKRLPLTLIVLPVDTTQLAIRLAAGSNAAPIADGTLTTEVYFTQPVASADDLNDIRFDVQFDRDLMGELRLTPAAGWSVATRSATSSGLTLECTRPNGAAISAGDVLLTILHRATVSRALTTNVRLANLVLNPAVARYSDCTLSWAIDSGGVHLALTPSCGDSELSRYLSDQPILTLGEVTPNPVHGASSHVQVTLRSAADITLEVLDPLGRVVSKSLYQKEAGSSSIDLPALPSGSYVVRVSAAGTVRSRLFVVER